MWGTAAVKSTPIPQPREHPGVDTRRHAMALFPIEHVHRLRSPAEAEALYRALGEKRVGARGLRRARLV